MKQYIKHSFAAKLNFYILFSLFVSGGIGFIFFHPYAARYIEQQTYNRLNESAEQTNLKVSHLLSEIEKISQNLSWIITSYVTEPDSIYNITRQVVKNNFEIFGCAIAFEPDFFPGKGHYFAPYSYMKGDSVITTEIGQKYDYYHKNWYKISKEQNISRWSRPYQELSANDITTSTYSVPLHNNNHKVIGIFSVDLSINWLSSLLDSVSVYDDCYHIIVNREGRYILRSSRKNQLNENGENILDVVGEMEDTAAQHIARQIITDQKGKGLFFNKGIQYYIYYTPLKGTQWTIATLFPYSHIFEGLHRFNFFLFLFLLLFSLLLILINSLIVRRITRPLKILASSTHAISQGDFTIPLPVVHTQDEMQALYQAFNDMQDKLSLYVKHLEKTAAAKEKIESELKIAHDIQMSMLPKTYPPFPERNEIDLYAVLYPARQVGGDLYDYFIKNDCLYFAIGDVSGKGIPASLLMASTISLLRTLAPKTDSPAQITHLLNSSISERNEADMFVTLFVGILNLKNGHMQYCNAGHTPPIITFPDHTIAFMDIQSDIPLGILQDYSYQNHDYYFTEGSGILLYTDGVTDAENPEHEFYTSERLSRVVQNYNQLHPQVFIQAILNDIRHYCKEQELSDDLTMLTFIYGTEWNIKNK